MYARFDFSGKLLAILLLGILLLTGCDAAPGTPAVTPSATGSPAEQPLIIGPEATREVALAYIRTYHPGTGPEKDVFWFEESPDQGEIVGSSTITYRYETWTVTVTYPLVAPDATIYNG